MARPGEGLDPLLVPFLDASEKEARSELERLVLHHATPVLGPILRSRFALDGGFGRELRADLEGEVLVKVLSRLWLLRADGAAPIRDFPAYVATTTRHAVDEHFRRRFRGRHRLKNQLRYFLSRSSTFSLWTSDGGRLICGFERCEGRDSPGTVTLHDLGDLPELPHEPMRQGLSLPRNAQSWLDQIFERVGGALELDDLTDILADRWGIQERLTDDPHAGQADSEATDPIAAVPDPSPDVEIRVGQRLYLERLWQEVKELPVRQRAALLLNLRLPGGGGVLALLPATGIATVRDIAEVLELSFETMAKLWRDLPLEDKAIAVRLDASRQQVINLRKSARARLARRMRALDTPLTPEGRTQ